MNTQPDKYRKSPIWINKTWYPPAANQPRTQEKNTIKTMNWDWPISLYKALGHSHDFNNRPKESEK